MRYSILLTLLVFIFSLISCSDRDSSGKTNSNKLEKAADAAVEFFTHIRKKDVRYIFENSVSIQAILLTPNDLENRVERFFNDFSAHAEDFWKEWPEALEDAKIEIVGYERVKALYSPGGALVSEISTEAYAVSLEITFTKQFSALMRNSVPLKQVVMVVPVYYDGDRNRYLVDWLREKQLPEWDVYWLRQN